MGPIVAGLLKLCIYSIEAGVAHDDADD